VSCSLVVFEDSHWPRLGPLADLTPVPALRLGAGTLADRWAGQSGAVAVAIEGRRGLAAAIEERTAPGAGITDGDEVLIVNAAALPTPALIERMREIGPRRLFTLRDRVLGALMSARDLPPTGLIGSGEGCETRLRELGFESVEVAADYLEWPWDLMGRNVAAIEADLARVPLGSVEGSVHPGAVLLEPGRIRIEAGACVDAGVVLDARGGPILIGSDAVLLPHSLVGGPCVVGAGTHVLGGAVRRSTFGPGCRVAGEVEESVWQGWANKRHHGFVGHSVVGEWVNLGALTTTSDLKNNYGPVRVWTAEGERDSGSNKVGSFIGAHVKTGIGTLLPTGCSIGVGSNLFGGGRFAPRRLPAFAWWDGERTVEHRLEKFLETAAIAMGRRGSALRPEDGEVLSMLFRSSAPERGDFLARQGGEASRSRTA